MLEYKGYTGRVEFDDEAMLLHGEVIGLRDVVTFQGKSVDELEEAFQDSVDDYLEFCEERGQQPDKPFSGRFLLRISPGLHRNIYVLSQREGKSLNQWISDYLEEVDRTEGGYYTITDHIDDVINVSGHKLSTVEIEDALRAAGGVAEAAVVRRNHEKKGEEPVGFVVLEQGVEYSEDFMSDLQDHVGREVGDLAKPGAVIAVDDLPKTNSGKIMRRLLENIAKGEDNEEPPVLDDPSIAETTRRWARDSTS